MAKFFRKDYVYIDSTKSFYKIHTIHRAWEDAKEMCDFEGATLFYPYDEDEAKAVINYWNQTLPFPWIFIGVSTPNVREVFETVDGKLAIALMMTFNENSLYNVHKYTMICLICQRNIIAI